MAGTDQYGQPIWADSDPVNLAVDLTKAADSRLTGLMRVGSSAERTAAQNVPEGCRWVETDTFETYLRKGGAWVEPRLAALLIEGGTVRTFNSGWANILTQGSWSVDDPLGVVKLENGRIKIQRAGMYRITVITRLQYAADNANWLALTDKLTSVGSPGAATVFAGGSSHADTTDSRVEYVGLMQAGDSWTPWLYSAKNTQTRTNGMRVLVERI